MRMCGDACARDPVCVLYGIAMFYVTVPRLPMVNVLDLAQLCLPRRWKIRFEKVMLWLVSSLT